jgi:hypothetical protein
MDIGYQTTETVTVTLTDASPARGPATQTNSGTTEPPPPPVIEASRGALCSDDSAAGRQPCRVAGTDGDPTNCTDVTCGFVHIKLSNWDPDTPVYCIANDHQPGQGVAPDTEFDSRFYFGVPGGTVHIYCEQLAKNTSIDITWPAT